MQVYRLGPKSGDTSDRNWEATTLNNKCWVLAESEADARQKVALATGIGPRLQRGATKRPTNVQNKIHLVTKRDSRRAKIRAGHIWRGIRANGTSPWPYHYGCQHR
jgi:hypothetical protein